MCKYCESDCYLDLRNNAKIEWSRKGFIINFESEDDATDFRINYCPMCGQKLD